MPLHDLNDYFVLSAKLRYQLDVKDASSRNRNVVALIAPGLEGRERALLERAVSFLCDAYGARRRKLGTPYVLHPLRTAALLSRTTDKASLLDLLTALFHDKLEDLTPRRTDPEVWERNEACFRALVSEIDPDNAWFLMERVAWLTRREESQTYNAYIGDLLLRTERTPELMRAKLADRLDNTLDLRVAVADPIEGIDFFRTLFQILFVGGYKGYQPEPDHVSGGPYNGAVRLYQLFKNAVILSLVRQTHLEGRDAVTDALAEALATASLKEAERIVLHICGYHVTDVVEQRRILMDAMAYVQRGGVDRATSARRRDRLDGLFELFFGYANAPSKERSLDLLYHDKPRMLGAAIAFTVIFECFLDDPTYFVHNVTADGVTAEGADEQ